MSPTQNLHSKHRGLGVLHPGSDMSELQPPHLGANENISYASGLPCYWQDKAPMSEGLGELSPTLAFAKRAMDIAVSFAALFFLAPFLMFVALAIKLTSSGPAVFRQPRVGRNGVTFWIYKFRTMYHESCSVDGVRQTAQNDDRITPIGKFLRQTSIDELPQFLNVLQGDMSLVGPRPHVEGQLASGRRYGELVPYYDLRSAMKPGITGWAQVNGLRGSTENLVRARARIEHDIAYIQNASIQLDVKILLMTLYREFLGGNGH